MRSQFCATRCDPTSTLIYSDIGNSSERAQETPPRRKVKKWIKDREKIEEVVRTAKAGASVPMGRGYHKVNKIYIAHRMSCRGRAQVEIPEAYRRVAKMAGG